MALWNVESVGQPHVACIYCARSLWVWSFAMIALATLRLLLTLPWRDGAKLLERSGEIGTSHKPSVTLRWPWMTNLSFLNTFICVLFSNILQPSSQSWPSEISDELFKSSKICVLVTVSESWVKGRCPTLSACIVVLLGKCTMGPPCGRFLMARRAFLSHVRK